MLSLFLFLFWFEEPLLYSIREGFFALLFALFRFDQFSRNSLGGIFLILFGLNLCFGSIYSLLYFLFLGCGVGCGLFLHLVLLLQHAVILHCLSPDDLTPTRFNFVGFGSNFVDFSGNHGLSRLVRTPLAYGAHRLGIQFIHASGFLLNESDNGNISNCSLHQGLGHDSVQTIRISFIFRRLSGLPASFFAFVFDPIVLVNFGGKFDVEFFVRREIILFIRAIFLEVQEIQKGPDNKCYQQVDCWVNSTGDFLQNLLVETLSRRGTFITSPLESCASVRINVHSLFHHCLLILLFFVQLTFSMHKHSYRCFSDVVLLHSQDMLR
mmetsp:Transcript_14866/g.41390  ORF Transcript_14866/g.41390 Transcript_14866/m.41390 type:complete len:324 (-) Transcript_14866:8-979(-)